MAKRAFRDKKIVVVDQILAIAGGINIDVIAAAAIERVSPGPAVKCIQPGILVQLAGHARRPLEDIVPGATVQIVVETAAIQGVIAVTTINRIGAIPAIDLVVTDTGHDGVVAKSGGYAVVAMPAVYGVVSTTGQNGVVPRRAVREHVERIGISDRVVTIGSRDIRQHINDIENRAIVEMNFLDGIEVVLPILDRDQVGQAEQIRSAVTDTDDHIVVNKGDPKIIRRNPRPELEDILGTGIQLNGGEDMP